MNVFVSGVNYKRTPLELREKLSIGEAEISAVLKQLHKLPGVAECVVLSTCNRTELYVFSHSSHFDITQVEELICTLKGLSLYSLKKHFYVYTGLKTVEHIFRVASGLDSQVLGENQILGQIKKAHSQALQTKTSASVLNTLFRQAITAAKKVKTCTGVSKNSVSIGSLAIQHLLHIYPGTLADKSALLIGTGKIGKSTLNNLLVKGVGKVYVTNRTHCKAQSLATTYPNVLSLAYHERYQVLDECDVVISCTNSPHYTVTLDNLEKALITEKKRIFIDLAVPRDIDTAIKSYPQVGLFCLDDLQPALDKNRNERLLEAKKAGHIIDKYILDFERWYTFRETVTQDAVDQDVVDRDVVDRDAAAQKDGGEKAAGEKATDRDAAAQDAAGEKAVIRKTPKKVLPQTGRSHG